MIFSQKFDVKILILSLQLLLNCLDCAQASATTVILPVSTLRIKKAFLILQEFSQHNLYVCRLSYNAI